MINIFFKTTQKFFESELENFSDMYFDSELHALSNGAIFRAIRALHPLQLDPAPFFSRI